MAVDTPATIAILGAGPIGLETALYARFLGYDVNVYERGEVGESVDQWDHVQLFTPFGQNSTPLGLAALAAQDEDFSPPENDELITGRRWLDEYLLPLSQTDLLSDHIHTNTTVVGVGRSESLKHDAPDPDRGDETFRLLLRKADGCEFSEEADIVVDCTGVFGNHNAMGAGGIPALGEQLHQAKIEYGLPDISGEDRDKFAGRRVLVVGSGYSAATNIVALSELDSPGTEISWAIRQRSDVPIRSIEGDSLASRDALARAANQAVKEPNVTLLSGVQITRIDHDGSADTFDVHFQRLEEECVEEEQSEEPNPEEWQQTYDVLLANVGYHADNAIFEQLQVHQCYATGGPMKLAAALMQNPTSDCLAQVSHGANSLITTEPNFYILGSKSYGRNSQFLYEIGRNQIRELFSLIGDREDLDLYAGASQLPQ